METQPEHLLQTRHGDTIRSISIDPSGKRVVTVGGWWLCIWKGNKNVPLSNASLVGAVSSYPRHLNVVQWDPCGGQIAFGGDLGHIGFVRQFEGTGTASFENETVVLSESWHEIRRFIGHSSDIVDIAWKQSTTMASASLDNTIIIWDVERGECMKRLTGHISFVKAIAWDPFGTFLASISDDRSLIVWELPQGRIRTVLKRPFDQSPVSSEDGLKIDWSPDGSKFVAVNATKRENVQLCAVVSRNDWKYEYRGIEAHGSITIARFNPFQFRQESKVMSYWCSAGTAGIVNIWKELVNGRTMDVRDKEPIATAFLNEAVSDLCWSPDGLALFIATPKGCLLKWRLESKLGERQGMFEPILERVPEGPLINGVIQRHQKRRNRKRIVPNFVESEVETSPMKRRRLGSLNPQTAGSCSTLPPKEYFRIPLKCRRNENCTITVFNRSAKAIVKYQEGEMHIWSLSLDLMVESGVGNERFLCLLLSNRGFMVVSLKSGSLLVPMLELDSEICFIDCDRAKTLVIVLANGKIHLYDLEKLKPTERIRLSSSNIPSRLKAAPPMNVQLTDDGDIEVHYQEGVFRYDKQRKRWKKYANRSIPERNETGFHSVSSLIDSIRFQGDSLLNGTLLDNDDLNKTIPTSILELEARQHHLQGLEDTRELCLCIMELVYTILNDYSPLSKWRGRKILFLCEMVVSNSVHFPIGFKKLFIQEIWKYINKENRVFGSLKRDFMILLNTIDFLNI